MVSSHNDRSRSHRSCRMGILTLLILSTSSTSAFTAITHATITSRKQTLVTRSSSVVVQRYRTDDDTSSISQPIQSSSNAYSFLPSRLSIERLTTPSQFQTQVLGESDTLVVVRYYADACPSCQKTAPLFRKWSRDIDTSTTKIDKNEIDNVQSNTDSREVDREQLFAIRIVEMPLNKATSSFLKDELNIEQLPTAQLYHPIFGLVEEQLVMNRIDFVEFVDTVNCWSKGVYEANLQSLVKSTSRR